MPACLADIWVVALMVGAGALTKYIDDCYDEVCFGGNLLRLSACSAGTVCLLLISVSAVASVFLAAITIGCLLAGKIDNRSFRMVAIAVAVGVAWRMVFMTDLRAADIVFWSLVAYADEKLNRLADAGRGWIRGILYAKLLLPCTAVIATCCFWTNPTLLLCVVGFDGGYHSVLLGRRSIARLDPPW
jgi:hypothetical protein